MPDAGPGPPWLKAWADVQQQLSELASDPAALQSGMVERYRRLFTPHGAPEVTAGDSGAAFIRCQQAAERFGKQATAIAIDASARFSAALSETGPQAPPITSLRELHALWIDCGEAAYAAHAHREEFAEAQAELLAAFVELRAGQGQR
jgi:imidazole glycerol phosphate synthase subunit HisF